jgi:hypothetical protein
MKLIPKLILVTILCLGVACTTDGETELVVSTPVVFPESPPAETVLVTFEEIIAPVIRADILLETHTSSQELSLGDNPSGSANNEAAREAPVVESTSNPGDQNPSEDQSGSTANQPAGGLPPQMAIDACDGLSQNENCSFNALIGLVEGSCNLIQTTLACVPAGGPSGGGQP